MWFADTPAKTLRGLSHIPELKERFEGVKKARLESPTTSVREQVCTPHLFSQNRQPKSQFLAVPEVSSEKREYIPIGFMDADSVPSNKIYMIPDVTEYEFGILTSRMHMDWMRVVAGRLESRYSYSPNVYHLFPFPNPSQLQRQNIVNLAREILKARQAELVKDPTTTLADMYDADFMPLKLRNAHNALDKAVDKLYKEEPFKTPLARVKHLFELHQKAE